MPIWTNISRRSAYFSSLFFVFRFRAFCVVVEFHSSHSFANFTANCSSFSCVYCENSTGFDVFNITVRLVWCFLCCCWVPLQPQFRQFFSDLLLIFVVFRGNSTEAVLLLSSTPATVFAIFQVLSSSISSFASYCQYCVVVEFTPTTVTPSPTPTPTPTLGHIFCSF